jgi:histidinol-phosphate/aromatic aminotransferase/cobyric acid decarboxylase-like protein
VRITIGTPEQNQRLVASLKKALDKTAATSSSHHAE